MSERKHILVTEQTGYDLIGDIHGHGDALEQLLLTLGYQDSGAGFCHPTRKVIFLGDFIDRGEHLRQHRKVLGIVMPMVASGAALAVMGNHEFNALAYHTFHNGDYLRKHTPNNQRQHQAFLNEFDDEPELKDEVLAFFYQLPLWLEVDGIRVVHACWDQACIDKLDKLLTDQCLQPEHLVAASTEGSYLFFAVERLLKGVEVSLPEGIVFHDKDGHERHAIRVQWWRSDAQNLGEVALPLGVDIESATGLPIPKDVPTYQPDLPACFMGHYWWQGKSAPLAPNIACLDYSVAKGGPLVAYRWQGEQVLCSEHFVSWKDDTEI